jgi:(p)ppGpp synthase/HD superfamily hydrolase
MWTDNSDPTHLARAVELAAHFHRGQFRKGTDVPYISHLLGVASLVAEDGGTEDEVIAGLLHDAAEDQGGEEVLAKIRAEVGGEVADIVRACSDSVLDKGEEKAPWDARKKAAISRLASTPEAALRVIAADKLHNTRATLADLVLVGPSVWERFKTGREGFIWYHEQVLTRLQELIPSSRSVKLLSIELTHLKSLE